METPVNNRVQEIGFRIWNINKSAILLYLSKKSATWTLPFIKTTSKNNVIDSILLLSDQFTKTKLTSAICILNEEKVVPIQLPHNTKVTDILFQYIIYDTTITFNNLNDIKLPDNIRFSQFVSLGRMDNLTYKTPILNYLMRYL